MDQADEAGAIAAAEYMVRLYAYALSTGELQEWEEVSSDTCEFCTNTRAEVERVYVPGGYFTGGEVESLFDTRVVGFDEQLGIYGVEVGFAISGGAEHAASGAVVDEFPAERSHVLIEVVPSDRGWVLVGGSASDGPTP